MKKFWAYGSCLLLVMTAIFWLSACAKRVTVSEEAAAPKAAVAEKVEVPAPTPAPAEVSRPQPIVVEVVKPPIEAPAGEVQKAEAPATQEGRTSVGLLPIYFDFDQYNVLLNQTSRLDGNAEWLKNHPASRIRIEGNCDERGSNEYNLALGERRANSCKEYLTNLGIAPERLETLTYGEEKPLCPDQNEECWSKNRRSDFVSIEE